MKNEDFNLIAAGYLMEDAPVLVFVLDMMGNILKCSEFCNQLTGKRLVGNNISDIIVDFHHSIRLQTFLEDEPGKEHLINIETRNGLPQTFYFKFIQAGEVAYACGRMDISEIEMLRKELLTLNNELNTLTRDLQKKNKKLLDLNRLKNQFLGMAAHDLRKPLSTIMLSSEFILSEENPVPESMYIDFLGKIHSASQAMKHLIDDFLNVAVIESGKLTLNIQPLNILDIFRNCREMNIHAAGNKNISLQFDGGDDLPLLHVDGLKIEQVINNLVENAIRYSEPGSSVDIAAGLAEENKGVLVTVSDRGRGIEKEQLQTMFQPFEAKSTHSVGLGLTIARKLIEAHSGEIWCDGEPGVGTTFSFVLPVAPGEALNDDG